MQKQARLFLKIAHKFASKSLEMKILLICDMASHTDIQVVQVSDVTGKTMLHFQIEHVVLAIFLVETYKLDWLRAILHKVSIRLDVLPLIVN